MHWSKKASLVCLSLCVEYAHATVSVTSSADSGPGTLREAIETIDAGTGTPPISLDPGVNPIVSSTMTVLTKDTAIIAGDAPTTHTIFGSGYHVLNAGTLEGTGSGVLVSVEKEILFSSASLLVSGGTIQIHGPLTGIVNIDIAGATPIMQFSTTGGVLAGTIQLLGDEESNIAVDPAISVEVTGTISGGRLTKIGAGRLFLPNANVYSGTVHSSGVIEVGHNQSLGVGPCIFHGAAILLIRTGLLIANEITFESSATIEVPGTASLTGLLKGNGSLTLVGGGYLSIEGGSSYVGSTSIASGTLAINKNGSIASSQGVWVAGTLDISGAYADVNINSLSGTESILLGSNTLIVSQLVTDLFSGVISGFGGLTLGQPGQNTLILSGVNTYTGATTINSGTLAISGLGSMASSSALTINTTGIFDISAATATVNVPTLSGDGNIFLGGEELSVNQTHAATLSGVISGTLGDFTL
ncbi:MAG: hypothetical protein FJZ58_06285, partial [Chlamydiae bacterium]|nr:hypothetical protein [Chlamydiota bacterium]